MFNAINDPVLAFVVIALVMLLSPLFAKRLRVPDLVLLLASGAVLGPNGLGLLERNAAMTLFGSVGMLYIMFLAGLEIDLNRFAQARGRSAAFGLLTFAVPQGVGTLVGFYVLGMNLPASLLLASMFASHTLLAASAASPTELAPGVVLLHVHCPGIDEAVVAVGSGHVHFPESAMEAEVVLGLFAPREQSAERHLLCLAELARRFNDAHIAARAAAGAPAEELCRLLVSNGPSRNK